MDKYGSLLRQWREGFRQIPQSYQTRSSTRKKNTTFQVMSITQNKIRRFGMRVIRTIANKANGSFDQDTGGV